jgi:hypothetical protein
VTSDCNGECKHCSVRPWMNFHKKDPYHLSMEDLNEFIYYTVKSHYNFDRITLVGGEPLMWKNLLVGIQILKTAFPKTKIKIITNGLLMTEQNKSKIEQIARYIDIFSISRYHGNAENIDFAKKLLPLQTYTTDGRTRRVPSTKLPSKIPPTVCECSTFTISGNRINFCSPMRTMGFLPPESITDDFAHLSRILSINFMDFFKGFKPVWMPCRVCVGNVSIRKYCKQVQNIVKEAI